MMQLFPNASEPVRDVQCFSLFKRGVTVDAELQKCGRPDEDPSSGVGCFIYHIKDGSLVVVHWTKMEHVNDIVHQTRFGKSISLFSRKRQHS